MKWQPPDAVGKQARATAAIQSSERFVQPMHSATSTGQDRQKVTEPPMLLSIPAVAHHLGVSVAHAWRLVYRGEIETIRIDKRVLVRREALEDFIGAHTLPAASREQGDSAHPNLSTVGGEAR